MGSDVMCGLSGLPIGSGEPILFFPLARVATESDSNPEVMTPLMPGAPGRYNEDSWEPHELAFAPVHRMRAQAMGFGDPRDALETAWNRQLESPASLAGSDDEWLGSDYALVRQDAWRALLSMPGSIRWVARSGLAITSANQAMQGVAAEIEECFAAIPALREQAAKKTERYLRLAKNDEDRRGILQLAELAGGADGFSRADLPGMPYFCHIFGERLLPGGSLSGAREDVVDSEMWRRAFHADTSLADARSVGRDMAELSVAKLIMRRLGKNWTPSRSAGPQRGPWAGHWLWLDALRDIAQAPMLAQAEEDSTDESGVAIARMQRGELSASAPRPDPSTPPRPKPSL